MNYGNDGVQKRFTAFIRIVALATINFNLTGVRLLIEEGKLWSDTF